MRNNLKGGRAGKWSAPRLLALPFLCFAGLLVAIGIGGFFYAPLASASGLIVSVLSSTVVISVPAPALILFAGVLCLAGFGVAQYFSDKVFQRISIDRISVRTIDELEDEIDRKMRDTKMDSRLVDADVIDITPAATPDQRLTLAEPPLALAKQAAKVD